jgi:hypothetical protein
MISRLRWPLLKLGRPSLDLCSTGQAAAAAGGNREGQGMNERGQVVT